MAEKQAKPDVGEIVHFYDPTLAKKIGFASGYGMRGIGPYAAIVVNDNGVGLDLQVFYPERQPSFVQEKVLEHALSEKGEEPEKPHWKWLSAAQKARAAKRLSEAEKADAGDA